MVGVARVVVLGGTNFFYWWGGGGRKRLGYSSGRGGLLAQNYTLILKRVKNFLINFFH